MTTTLLLIRHGVTDWNQQGRWQGHADVPLNEEGLQQANALAQRLASWPIQTLYTSDLKRTAQTAVPLGQALNLTPIHDPIWRERDVGDFSGFTTPEIREKFPQVWQEMRHGIINPPNGETHLKLRERARLALEKVLNQHQDEMVAVVSHGGVLNAAVCHVLEIPVEKFGRLSFRGNTGLSIIHANSNGARLTRLNDTSHLE